MPANHVFISIYSPANIVLIVTLLEHALPTNQVSIIILQKCQQKMFAVMKSLMLVALWQGPS